MVDTKADWVQATTVTSANNLRVRLVSNENTHTNLLPHTDAAFRKSGYDLAGHWQSLNSSTRGMLGHAAFTQETENVRTGRRTLYQLFRVSEHGESSPLPEITSSEHGILGAPQGWARINQAAPSSSDRRSPRETG
ncbi:hypothetical protein NL676_001104 [Syzygium grande]|nr:hypothetical protein NL676_001104 [Syzygium grande]